MRSFCIGFRSRVPHSEVGEGTPRDLGHGSSYGAALRKGAECPADGSDLHY